MSEEMCQYCIKENMKVGSCWHCIYFEPDKKESPQNLPKANACSLLAEVRADLKVVDEFIEEDCFGVEICEAWERIKNKVGEHFS